MHLNPFFITGTLFFFGIFLSLSTWFWIYNFDSIFESDSTDLDPITLPVTTPKTNISSTGQIHLQAILPTTIFPYHYFFLSSLVSLLVGSLSLVFLERRKPISSPKSSHLYPTIPRLLILTLSLSCIYPAWRYFKKIQTASAEHVPATPHPPLSYLSSLPWWIALPFTMWALFSISSPFSAHVGFPMYSMLVTLMFMASLLLVSMSVFLYALPVFFGSQFYTFLSWYFYSTCTFLIFFTIFGIFVWGLLVKVYRETLPRIITWVNTEVIPRYRNQLAPVYQNQLVPIYRNQMVPFYQNTLQPRLDQLNRFLPLLPPFFTIQVPAFFMNTLPVFLHTYLPDFYFNSILPFLNRWFHVIWHAFRDWAYNLYLHQILPIYTTGTRMLFNFFQLFYQTKILPVLNSTRLALTQLFYFCCGSIILLCRTISSTFNSTRLALTQLFYFCCGSIILLCRTISSTFNSTRLALTQLFYFCCGSIILLCRTIRLYVHRILQYFNRIAGYWNQFWAWVQNQLPNIYNYWTIKRRDMVAIWLQVYAKYIASRDFLLNFLDTQNQNLIALRNYFRTSKDQIYRALTERFEALKAGWLLLYQFLNVSQDYLLEKKDAFIIALKTRPVDFLRQIDGFLHQHDPFYGLFLQEQQQENPNILILDDIQRRRLYYYKIARIVIGLAAIVITERFLFWILFSSSYRQILLKKTAIFYTIKFCSFLCSTLIIISIMKRTRQFFSSPWWRIHRRIIVRTCKQQLSSWLQRSPWLVGILIFVLLIRVRRSLNSHTNHTTKQQRVNDSIKLHSAINSCPLENPDTYACPAGDPINSSYSNPQPEPTTQLSQLSKNEPPLPAPEKGKTATLSAAAAAATCKNSPYSFLKYIMTRSKTQFDTHNLSPPLLDPKVSSSSTKIHPPEVANTCNRVSFINWLLKNKITSSDKASPLSIEKSTSS